MKFYGYETMGKINDLLGVESKTLIEVSFWKYLYLVLFGYRTKVNGEPNHDISDEEIERIGGQDDNINN